VSDRNPAPPGICLSMDRPEDIERSFATVGLCAGDVDVIVCSAPHRAAGGADTVTRAAAASVAAYTAGGGIRPDRVLGVSLRPRRGGADPEAFLDRYLRTASRLFPGALLHVQNFGAAAARALAARGGGYRVLDSTWQCTGAAVLAALYAAARVTGIPVRHQAVLVFGAGPAAAAMTDQVRGAMVTDGATGEQAHRQVSRTPGLRAAGPWPGGPDTDGPGAGGRGAGGPGAGGPGASGPGAGGLGASGLAGLIRRTAPTALLGVSGMPRAFTPQVVEAMCEVTSRPVILPVSAPASRAEATPADILAWSAGRALVACAFPARPVGYRGTTYRIGQLDSTLVFPGVGLGVLVSGAARVTPRMLQSAAAAVAEQAGPAGPGAPLLAEPRDLRAVSAQVAEAVVQAAVADKVAMVNPTGLARAVRAAMWAPARPDTG
jgi:malate dehydrogenase (oxaloacetate-decarboxylating)